MLTSRRWQLDSDSARGYEEVIVPFILGPAARMLVEWAGPAPGMRVLDVGCGTGIVGRLSLPLIAPDGSVTGIDINEGMIAVARDLAPDIAFHVADAAESGLPDGIFDLVLCAQVLQFVPNRPAAIVEMARLTRPGGMVAFSTWSQLSDSPYFDAQVTVVANHLGDEVAGGLAAGFTLTDTTDFAALLRGAGLESVDAETVILDLPLGSLMTIIPRHIMATPLAARFSAAPEAVQTAIIDEMTARLTTYVTADGSATVPFGINLARGKRPGPSDAG